MKKKASKVLVFSTLSVCLFILGLLCPMKLDAQINLKWVERDYVICSDDTTATMATDSIDRTKSVTVDNEGNS